MKKFAKILSLIVIFSALACIFVSCNSNQKADHTVTFMTVSSITYTKTTGMICSYVSKSKNKISVKDGEIIGPAPVDTKYGSGTLYRFIGWYTEKDYINRWDLYKDEVRSDLTLYPKYERISQFYD